MGVSMLPRFAATVWSTTSGTMSRSCLAMRSDTSPKGTKVMSATSFVTIMLPTKGRPTSTASSARVPCARRSSAFARQMKSPACWKPFITAMSEKSRASVSQSM